MIGNFRLLEQIGAGGMGIVYRAEQVRPVRRVVALKLIKLGMDTREVVARFESERQALAMLEHPGIARVYDAGAAPDTGRPYFVMEYVPGRPITEYCDQKCLPTARRLELFEQVCPAVQYAHYKGILHRDLKPSNILVAEIDGKPQAKIIDFGVAKATRIDSSREQSLLATRAGQLVGTPMYMSPEQAAGDEVDTRADVYSLGVVLYELLTGALPFDPSGLRGGDSSQLIRQILETDPPRPSTRITAPQLRGADEPALRRQVRGDLDRIVLKAMQRDRAQRYGTAAALAEDVRRHLNHEPVAARPPTLAYQARKFARRNRVFVTATAMVVLAAIIGGAAAMFGLVRAREALAEARASQRAAQNVNQFLVDMLGAVDPTKAQGDQVLVRDVLDRAAKDLGQRFGNQPLAAAALHAIVGNTYHALGLYEPARLHWQSAVNLRRAELRDDHAETLDALNSLATCLSALGRRAEAEAILRELLPSRRRLVGDEHPSTLIAEESLGLLLAAAERVHEADPLLRHVLETRRRTLGDDHPSTLAAMHNSLAVAEQLGRKGEAIALNRAVVAGRQRTLGANHPSTILSMSNLATMLLKQDRPDDAEPLLVDALSRAERVLGPEHATTLTCMNSLASVYRITKRLDRAEAMSRALVERLRRALPENHPNTFTVMGTLAMTLEDAGKVDEALAIYRELYDRALAIERAGTASAVEIHWMITPYGQRLAQYGRFDEAEVPLREGLRALEAAGKKRTARGIDVIDALALTCERTGNPTAAARWRTEAATLRAAAGRAGVPVSPAPTTHPTTAAAR